MKKEQSTPTDAAERRRRAEEQLKVRKARAPTGDSDARHLVHELEVHQVELEMQNEELRGARLETEAALARYTELYDFAPTGYVTLADDGVIQETNFAAAMLLGKTRSELAGERFTRFVSPGHHAAFRALFSRTSDSHDRRICELQMTNVPRDPLWLQLTATSLPSATRPGHEIRILLALADITERQERERKLAETIKLLNASQSVARLGTFVLDAATGRWSSSPVFDHLLDINAGFDRTRTGLLSLVHPDERAAIEACISPLVEGHHFDREFRVVRRTTGEVRWVWGRGELECDVDGRPLRLLGTVQDVHERRRSEDDLRRALANAEEGRRLLDALLRYVPTGIAVADASDERIRRVSRHGSELIGNLPEVVEGIPLSEHAERWGMFQADGVTPARSEALPLSRATCHGEVVSNEEWVIGTPTGERIPVLCSAGPIYSAAGGLVGGVMAWRDIRKVKLAEETLREADRRKDAFLAMLAHELRNPLAPIRSAVDLQQRARGDLAVIGQAREVIDRQVSHLVRMIDDLLDVTRISQGKLRLRREPLDLREVVRHTAEDLRPAFETAGVTLSVSLPDEPVPIDADRTRVAQIVGNLLSNATKFTPHGGQTWVAVVHEVDEHVVVLTVRDNGVGISAEMQGRLFQPFAQADDSLERTRGGLGLGLSLVKTLVEMHGGDVSATSEGTGKGTQIVVRWPLVDTTRDQRTTPEAAPVMSPLRVLVIDDNVDSIESLRLLLELDGHDVEVAYTGPAGVEVARRFGPDVVFCDIGLPGMNGYEVARALRTVPEARSAYLVALSGYAANEDVARARAAGFDRHLAKPARVSEIEQCLRRPERHSGV